MRKMPLRASHAIVRQVYGSERERARLEVMPYKDPNCVLHGKGSQLLTSIYCGLLRPYQPKDRDLTHDGFFCREPIFVSW